MTQLQTNRAVVNDIVNEAGKSSESTSVRKSSFGRTIGDPKLSDTAKEYYDQLKKKFNNFDFILVSRDEKENAKANAARYAGGSKTVVLIDEDKIERMATDANYRKKYEDILSGAADSIDQLKNGLSQNGIVTKSLGMQVNDDGTVSYFAVLKKMSSDQKARIEEKQQEKLEEKKAEKKAETKAEKKAEQEKTHDRRFKDTVTFSANSVEELLKKIEDYSLDVRSDNVLTNEEKMIGGNIDFRG